MKIATSNKSRERVAAEIFLRDYAHLVGEIRATVATSSSKMYQLIFASDREARLSFGESSYNRAPIQIIGDEPIRRARNAVNGNKRLCALVDIAIATKATLSFEYKSSIVALVRLDASITKIEGRTPETLAAAADWLRIEHEEAVNALSGRSQGSAPDFRIAYPSDPVECIKAVERGIARIAEWATRTAQEPLVPIPTGDEAVAALRDLLNEIPAKRLTKGQAKKLNAARAIVGRMIKAIP